MIMVISKPKKNWIYRASGKKYNQACGRNSNQAKKTEKKSTCRLFNACDSMSVLYFSAAPKISPYNVKAHVGEKGTG